MNYHYSKFTGAEIDNFLNSYAPMAERLQKLEEIVEHYKIPQTCEKCGAPLRGNRCEYCGTEYAVTKIERSADCVPKL